MSSRPTVADFCPVQRTSAGLLAEHLRGAGFYAGFPEVREGMNALAFRPDVTMRDLCETITARLRALRGVLAMIETDEDTPMHVTQAAEAALMLATEVAGFHEVVYQGVLIYRDGGPHKSAERSSS